MLDATSKIDENGDLGHQHDVIKDTAGMIFMGELPLFFLAGCRTLNLLCSCCRHNTFSYTYHVCSNDVLPRGTVESAG